MLKPCLSSLLFLFFLSLSIEIIIPSIALSHETTYNGRVQQGGTLYEMNTKINPVYPDFNRMQMSITGNRANGHIAIHANGPKNMSVPGYPGSNGTNVYNYHLSFQVQNGLISLQNFSNDPSSFGIIQDVMVFGSWNEDDEFHAIYSYQLWINGSTIVLNSRFVLTGSIHHLTSHQLYHQRSSFIGMIYGISIPYIGSHKQPYEIVWIVSHIDSSQFQWNIMFAGRVISPYGSIYLPSISSTIVALPAPFYISGTVQQVSFQNGVLHGLMSVSSINNAAHIINGTFSSDYFILDSNLGLIQITNGDLNDTLNDKRYLMDNFLINLGTPLR